MQRPVRYSLAALIVAIVGASLYRGGSDTAPDTESAAAAAAVPGRASVGAPDAATGGGRGGRLAAGPVAGPAPDDDAAGGEAGSARAAAESGDNVIRIPIPPEFEAVFARDEALAGFHERLEAQAEDPLWAARIEDFLTSQFTTGLDLSQYRIESIECRASACEILAVGYGDDALRGWMRNIGEMIDSFDSDEAFEAFFGGPGRAGCGGSDLAPGVIALNCTFERTAAVPAEAEADAAPAAPRSLDQPYAAGIVVEPVAVAESVAPAIESNPQMYDLHRRLEQQSTDYGWANYVEPLIGEYVNGLDSDRGLELLDVTCRTTLCEVQMIAHDENAVIDLLPAMFEFSHLEWHDLAPAGLDGADAVDGESTGLVWFLERHPPEE